MSETTVDTGPVVADVDAFREAFRDAAVAERVMEPESGRSRDENGRFAKTEEAPVETPVEEPTEETPVEAPAEPVEETPAETLLAGKYKTPEALEQGYLEAQKKLGETARDANAYKELQAEVQALREQLGEPAKPSYDPGSLQEWLDENPGLVPQAAIEASQRGDDQLFDAAMNAWYQLNPRQASSWERQRDAEKIQSDLDAKIAQVAAPIQQQQQAQEFELAIRNLAGEYPEISQESFATQMEQHLASRPWMLSVLATGDLAAKQSVLADLANITRGTLTPKLAQATSEMQKAQQAEAAQAKTDAAVLTAGNHGDAVPQGNIAAFREAFRNSPEFKRYTQ